MFICHLELDTVWGPDTIAEVGGPGLPMTEHSAAHSQGTYGFLRNPSSFSAGGEVADSSFSSL